MIRKIVQYGHPVLRQSCRPITEVDDALVQLVGETPISPPSGPTQWLFQQPPAESKFLAAAES